MTTAASVLTHASSTRLYVNAKVIPTFMCSKRLSSNRSGAYSMQRKHDFSKEPYTLTILQQTNLLFSQYYHVCFANASVCHGSSCDVNVDTDVSSNTDIICIAANVSVNINATG